MTNDDTGMTKISKSGAKRPSRRSLLKGAAAVAGAAVVGDPIRGFPTVWAQDIKDIELRHIGVSYSVVQPIGVQASKDLGFKVSMQNLDTSAAINRFITQPNTVDIADLEGWQAKLAAKRGVIQGIETKKIKEFDNFLPIFTKGELDGHKIPRQGISPYQALYLASKDATELHDGVSDWMTNVPQVYNADSLGYRPDLIGHPVTEWKELINPKYKGKAAILDVPAIGIMDAALCFESADLIKYGDKGNMTKPEIDKTIDFLIKTKKEGQFRAFWKTFDESVNLMTSGEVVIQSMWSPAVAAVRSKGVACKYQPLKEGYRSWGDGLAIAKHLKGPQLDAAYDYINWYLSGWAGAFLNRQGYYSAVLETAKANMSEDEWGFWMEGKPAKGDIKSPQGVVMEKAGAVRDGGSFYERMVAVSCWNAVMDEDRYMVQKWNQFIAA